MLLGDWTEGSCEIGLLVVFAAAVFVFVFRYRLRKGLVICRVCKKIKAAIDDRLFF
jgi:hypothetical protein